jgi:shikimate dehydrogenase
VKSPAHLSAALAARGVNALVVPAHVLPPDLPAFMAAMAATRNVDGVIATVPHKQAVLAHCLRATERVRYAGAANVLRRTAGGWEGDHTDGRGFVEGVTAAGGTVGGSRVLLVGAGGAGSAIAYELLARSAAELAIHDLDRTRRDRLVGLLAARFPGRVAAGTDDPAGFDIVGNATPAGMHPDDEAPVRLDRLSPGQVAADVVTRPEITPFLARARSLGCKVMPGLGMFKAQEALLVDFLLSRQESTTKREETHA